MRIKNIQGTAREIDCIACHTAQASPEYLIAKTTHFRAEQDYEVPLPGFVIIASDRHFYGLDEMGDAEQVDFVRLLCKMRKFMRQKLGVQYVHLIMDERSSASHFHAWLFPHYSWMNEQDGVSLRTIPNIMQNLRDTPPSPKQLQEVEQAVDILKKAFASPAK